MNPKYLIKLTHKVDKRVRYAHIVESKLLAPMKTLLMINNIFPGATLFNKVEVDFYLTYMKNKTIYYNIWDIEIKEVKDD